jgi:hypothetical protein
MKETIISKRGEQQKVKGQFFVTYSAVRYGKKYTTTHLNPCGFNDDCEVSADELNKDWANRYEGLCPFNGDTNFEVIKLQQRF